MKNDGHNVRKVIGALVVGVLAIGVFGLGMNGASWASDLPESGAMARASLDLAAESGDIRQRAARMLTEQRQAMIEQTLALLREHRGSKLGDEGAPVHLLVETLGNWRASEAAGLLVEMIDFRARLMDGDKRQPGAAFPCARALAQIAGPEVLGAIERGLRKESTPQRHRLLSWVVFRLFGEELGGVYLTAQAEGSAATAKESLLKARNLLKEGNLLVRVE